MNWEGYEVEGQMDISEFLDDKGASMTENEQNKEVYEITLNGCDDDTVFTMELTEQEYRLLVRVSEVANETSTYGCMPRMYIERVIQV